MQQARRALPLTLRWRRCASTGSRRSSLVPAGARQSHQPQDPAPAPQSAQGPLQQPLPPCAAIAEHWPPPLALLHRQKRQVPQAPSCRVELRSAAALAGCQHPAAEQQCQQRRVGWLPGLQTRLCREYSAAEAGSWAALGRRRARRMVLRVLMTVRGIRSTVTSILWCFLSKQRQCQMPMPSFCREA